ncbi:hypothetical protein B0F90DRAFT_1817435 [Multifurca ochricompacta]|uniref:Uncharacterized protein n=1 Tax=Multifurca ochricompacta TaxID=376703 RepID=A0AAD4QNE7_9AGAM|nr:hypothetical protein B0F90DRAFT_1817435 [Multifurca ochricompacta]
MHDRAHSGLIRLSHLRPPPPLPLDVLSSSIKEHYNTHGYVIIQGFITIIPTSPRQSEQSRAHARVPGKLFNILINPIRSEFALCWHRDDIKGTVSQDEERAALAARGVTKSPVEIGEYEYHPRSSYPSGCVRRALYEDTSLLRPWFTLRPASRDAESPIQRHRDTN